MNFPTVAFRESLRLARELETWLYVVFLKSTLELGSLAGEFSTRIFSSQSRLKKWQAIIKELVSPSANQSMMLYEIMKVPSILCHNAPKY